MRIIDLVPDADDLLALEVEELAGVLLVHLNNSLISFRNSTTAPFGQLNYKGFFAIRSHPWRLRLVTILVTVETPKAAKWCLTPIPEMLASAVAMRQ